MDYGSHPKVNPVNHEDSVIPAKVANMLRDSVRMTAIEQISAWYIFLSCAVPVTCIAEQCELSMLL